MIFLGIDFDYTLERKAVELIGLLIGMDQPQTSHYLCANFEHGMNRIFPVLTAHYAGRYINPIVKS